MRVLKKQTVKIIIILFLAGFIGSCNKTQKQSSHPHDETETMDGHDHSAEDNQHMMEDGETMADSTSMEDKMQ